MSILSWQVWLITLCIGISFFAYRLFQWSKISVYERAIILTCLPFGLYRIYAILVEDANVIAMPRNFENVNNNINSIALVSMIIGIIIISVMASHDKNMPAEKQRTLKKCSIVLTISF